MINRSDEGAPVGASQMNTWRAWLAAAGALALLALLFYAPILSGLWTFPDGDFNHHFLPFSQFMADAWRTLTPPLWNPYTYSGHPFWADVQAAVLYPVSNLLLLVTLPVTADSARFYLLEVEAVLHVLLGGLFLLLLAYELTRRLGPALMGAITFMLSGYLTGYPPLQLAVLRTAIWLPLLLWLLLRAWRNPARWRYWMGAAGVFAVAFLAGHTQTWMFMAYAVAGWIAVLALGHAKPAEADGGVVARAVGIAAFALLALGLVTAQLLPSVEFSQLTVRADADYAFLSGGFPKQDTWQLLLPGVFTQFSPLYVGVIPLGLAVFGAIAGLGRNTPSLGCSSADPGDSRFNRTAVGYFAVVALVGLLVSYGENGFLYPLLYRVAPGWDLFRGQERAAYLVAFGLSLLAAYGLAFVPGSGMRLRRRYALAFGALVTGAVYAFGLFWQLPGRTAIGPWAYLAIAAYTLVFAMTLALTVWLPGWSVRREWLLCGLAAANLFVANVATNLTMRTPAEAVTLAPEVAALQSAMADASNPTGLAGRAYNEFRVYDDYGMQAGVEDVWGSSPLRLSHYAVLFDEFPLDRMFRLTGVSQLLTWRRELFEPSELLAEFPQQDDTTYLHRLEEPNPRSWVVGKLVCADDADAVALLADHDFDLETTAVMPLDSGAGEWRADTSGAQVHAERTNARTLTLDVTNSNGSVLVVSENWMPGWRVEAIECDGNAACEAGGAHSSELPLLTPVRANLSFLAIALPEGDVRFQLVYAPSSVRLGVLISVLTLAMIAVASIVRVAFGRQETARP